ncbi:Acyltransferase BOA11 [Colletotrichum siamense]|uniref:Acyltransferase BOA11 n=1 Tax=Colletotrichum siamense TaxID=690259 RepID=UPI001872B931|nr:Acyltransferase BOA11 [Colletotrichum siamense]KAF5497672.1 Acyltransferase BOA11 [Colletotrichum siamense]
MARVEVHHLHPTNWESDPEEEIFPLSTLDYLSGQIWCNYVLFFKLPSATPDSQSELITVLKAGLERTLSQVRQLPGVLTKHPSGSGLCWHKKREDTVEFHVQWLDNTAATGKKNKKYPTFADLEKQHFSSKALGDPKTWSVHPFKGGQCPESHWTSRPKAAAYKATFIPGGMIFMMHHHHFSGDIMAWSGQLHQLAENCNAIWAARGTGSAPKFPAWDPACLDFSLTTKADLPASQQVDGPSAAPERNAAYRPSKRLLFHLPKSKMAKLKKLAAPPDEDGEEGRWISSYDAYTAHIWRVLSKHKAALYEPDLKEALIWGEAVNMRPRFRDPVVPARIQSNFMSVAVSFQSVVPTMSGEEVISSAPFWKLAWYIRQLTNTVTQDYVNAMLASLAPIRDKTTLFIRGDAFHPMTTLFTDWRDTRPCEADFGFGAPYAFRWLFESVQTGMFVTYPARVNGAPAGADEGTEFSLPVEREVAAALLADPEWSEYFEYRGVENDVDDVEGAEEKETETEEEAVAEVVRDRLSKVERDTVVVVRGVAARCRNASVRVRDVCGWLVTVFRRVMTKGL